MKHAPLFACSLVLALLFGLVMIHQHQLTSALQRQIVALEENDTAQGDVLTTLQSQVAALEDAAVAKPESSKKAASTVAVAATEAAAHAVHDFKCMPTVGLDITHKVVMILQQEEGANRGGFAINLGAREGKGESPNEDPVYPVFSEMHYAGVAIEGDPKWNAALHSNLPANNISKVISFITPENVGKLLHDANSPMQPELLKIDIDGYDCSIIEAIFGLRYLPKIVHMEVNGHIPPPFEFAVGYSPDYKPNSGFSGFYGCSIAKASAILRPHGYALISGGGVHGVIFALQSLKKNIGRPLFQDHSIADVSKCSGFEDSPNHFLQTVARGNFAEIVWSGDQVGAVEQLTKAMRRACALYVDDLCQNSFLNAESCSRLNQERRRVIQERGSGASSFLVKDPSVCHIPYTVNVSGIHGP